MNKRALIAVLVVVLAAVGVVAAVVNNRNDKTDNQNTGQQGNTGTSQQDNSGTHEAPMPSPQGTGGEGGTGSAPQTTDKVAISDFAFSPQTITVKAGTAVTWTNNDSTGHTVTADDDSAGGPDSELLEQGESYSFTFQKAGTYKYHCTPHPNMQGTVIVTE